ncbi:MAG: glycosyltransferase family A protein [Planctomycetota bacterium]
MLRSLAAQDARAPDGRPLVLEFVLVDNASPQRDDATMDEIRRFGQEVLPGRVVLHDRNAGYAGGMNLALEHATGDTSSCSTPTSCSCPAASRRCTATSSPTR